MADSSVPARAGRRALRETYGMLAVALVSLGVAFGIVRHIASACRAPVPVLLESMARLTPSAGRPLLRIDELSTSAAEGSRTARPGSIVLAPNQALQIRGRAVDPATGGQAAAVFAVLDARQAYRATYDGHVGGNRFSVVVPADGVSAGTHAVHLRVVAADQRGYYEAGSPLPLIVR